MGGHGPGIRLHQGKIVAIRVQLEVGVECPPWYAPILAGCEHDQELAGADIGGRKPPFVQTHRSVGETPVLERNRSRTIIEDLDPILVIPILVTDAPEVGSCKFTDPDSSPGHVGRDQAHHEGEQDGEGLFHGVRPRVQSCHMN